MSDPASVNGPGTPGPWHAGQGDLFAAGAQYFNLTLTGGLGWDQRRERANPDDELRWLERRFVYPAGFGQARDILASDARSVFLAGIRGTGRVSTARMLLWELRLLGDISALKEMVPEGDDDRPLLNFSQVTDRSGMWLDLSESELFVKLEAELSPLRGVVQQRAARLVVILPGEATSLPHQLGGFRAEISQPRPVEVMRRHLRAEAVPCPQDLASLPSLVRPRTPGEVSRYVQQIIHERGISPGGSIAEWAKAADAAFSGADQTGATALIDERGEGGQRALLLATAMLHGAHADVVIAAADALLTTLGHPNQAPALERRTVHSRLGDIRAASDELGSVRFDQPEFDSAVRTVVWNQLPHLRVTIRDLVASVVEEPGLTDEDREHLVTCFMVECLTSRQETLWTGLVERWTGNSTTRTSALAAAWVLRTGLLDDQNARAFRKRIYWWSLNGDIPRARVEVITAACRDVMARKHPEEALVRLHHLARRRHGTSARDALVVVVGQQRWLLRYMLSRLAGSSRYENVDASLFLRFADPAALTGPDEPAGPLLAEPGIRDYLTEGWALVFRCLDPAAWEPLAMAWLGHAAMDSRFRDDLIQILVDAVRMNTDVLARLFSLVQAPDLGPVIRRLVLAKINAAMELPSEVMS